MIGRLLTLPVTGPFRAGWWLLEQVVEAAERARFDEAAILRELRHLAAAADAGQLGEEEHAAAEELLLARLAEARAHRRGEPV